MTNDASWQVVLDLLTHEHFGALGTTREGHAYTSLVAFAAAPDGRELYFATTRATRKYHNLNVDARVALLIDNRGHHADDLYTAAAVSAYGRAEELTSDQQSVFLERYLTKHPQLQAFIRAPSTALFRIRVDCYHLVRRFQDVTEFRITSCPS